MRMRGHTVAAKAETQNWELLAGVRIHFASHCTYLCGVPKQTRVNQYLKGQETRRQLIDAFKRTYRFGSVGSILVQLPNGIQGMHKRVRCGIWHAVLK